MGLDRLVEEGIFSWRDGKDGILHCLYEQSTVTTLRGSQAAKLRNKLLAATGEHEVQSILARATGNFKRGNERTAKAHPKHNA